jgi:DNA-binding NarL/FixJ family response regulator
MIVTTGGNRIRIVLIDDHPIALAGFRVGLKRFSDIEIVGEAVSGAEGLRLIEERHPAVAVVDVLLPDTNGLEVAARARDVWPQTQVIITSGDLSVATMSRGTQLGVAGYFHKSGAIERLAILIRETAGVVDPAADHAEAGRVREGAPHGGLDALTPREHELLALLANGVTLKQAAAHLGVSYKSADHAKQSLMRKLDIHNRVDLVRFAIREHLVHDPA